MLPSANWLGLSYFTYFFSFGIFLPFWSVWLQGEHISSEKIGILLGAGMISRFIGSLFMAPIVKKNSQLIIAIRILALFTLIFSITFSFCSIWLWLLLIISGFSLFYGPLIPLTDALAATWQHQIGLDYGKVRLWGSMAFILGSAVTGKIVNIFNHQAIMYFLWASLAMMLLGMLLRPQHMPKDSLQENNVPHTTKWKILLTESSVWRFLLCTSLQQGAHAGYYGFSTIYWQAAGYSASVVGYLWALGVVAEVIIFALSKRLFCNLSVSRLLLISCICAVIRWTLMGTTTTLLGLICMQILHAGSFTICHIAAMRFIAARQGGDVIRLQAIYSALGMGGSVAIMTIVSGFLFQKYQGNIFYVMALVVLPVLFFRTKIK
ncbi:putative 3-phenylpropionic acid transporter [Candidatus Profftia lariciata]|uniref:3-phenylpropionate MFS transporter n=1 Tax=Candidatus Profftia lariciata TaxID=1987921 RepID=UPI001D02D5E3|nr:3-phenylpropionate MFS transporter [Candidatus Profftia lariciata]UDG81251.1 putative 3-phenylpropionic acid transporter [Candidatus Profftia lariciata]